MNREPVQTTRRNLLLTAGALAGGTLLSRQGFAQDKATPQAGAGVAADPAFADAVSVSDLQAIAQRRLEPVAREYTEGAAAEDN